MWNLISSRHYRWLDLIKDLKEVHSLFVFSHIDTHNKTILLSWLQKCEEHTLLHLRYKFVRLIRIIVSLITTKIVLN